MEIGLHAYLLNNFVTKFKESHSYNTRFNENYILDQKRTKTAQNTIFFKGIQQYNNKLPNSIKNIDNFKICKV